MAIWEAWKKVGNRSGQIVWINCAKFTAMLAVLVDHTNGVLYTDQNIAVASYFSVALFILLSGMTSYMANNNRRNISGGGIRSCKKIILAYCIAVAVYLGVLTKGFDLSLYLYHLTNFNISGPHYFVLLYIQLMACNKILFRLLEICPESPRSCFFEGIIFAGILAFSSWTTRYTNILNVYGGGGKLFGGTYLVLYYLGMLVQKHGWLRKWNIIKSAGMFAFFGSFWFLFWRYTCKNGYVLDQFVPFGQGNNPPSVTLSIAAICMLFACFGLFTLLEQTKYLFWVSLLAGMAGKHTLYIFLYHRLILDHFLLKYMADLPYENIWLARVLFLGTMIIGSWLVERLVEYMHDFLDTKKLEVKSVENQVF